MSISTQATLTDGPVPRLGAGAPYAPPVSTHPIDLHLDANEGPDIGLDLGAIGARVARDGAQRYPSVSGLEQQLAVRFNVSPARVVVTAGGDDAIDRTCRAYLGPGSELILPVPTFEMIGRYATIAGADIVTTPWESGACPVEAVLDRITPRTRMIAVVSPNNPTGAVATAPDLERVSRSAPDALVLVDLAYAEFADEDLTSVALALPNTVVIRTFSKAYGLAGMRVGYAMGGERAVRALRSVGAPYPVSSLSAGAAATALGSTPSVVSRSIARIREERRRLVEVLRELGAAPRESQGNFVLADFADAGWVWAALAGLGISVRRFARGSGLEQSLRITCPGSEEASERVCAALRAVLRPQALLLDMDGVIADVSRSYRRAIELTAASFGVPVTPGDISEAKARGDANNDWVLTHRLVTRARVPASLEEVTSRFERIYQGTEGAPGLRMTESLIPDRAVLERLARRIRLGIVTGRPRSDAERFARSAGIEGLFSVMVCMEDAPPKPDPSPVRCALERMGVIDAWMIGDTPDDIVAARGARVVPIGIAAPGLDEASQRDALVQIGAARVLNQLTELEGMVP